MYVSINQKGEIKEVGVSSDISLTSVYIADETSPFIGWSEAKICCYKITVNDGIVTMLTPYVDSRMIEHFDQLGRADEQNAEGVVETQAGLMETFEQTDANSTSIIECENALMEVYELIEGGV